MSKNKSVETETHTRSQVRYKIFTELVSIEKTMDLLLEDNVPCDVEKIVIQPKTAIEEYSNGPGVTGNYNVPWVKHEPWKTHNRIE